MKSVHILPLTATALIAAAMIVISVSAFADGTITGSGSISGTAGVRSNATTQTTARATASTNASRNSVVGGQALGTSVLDVNTLPGDTALTVRGPMTADENAMLTNLNFNNSDSNHDQRLNAQEFTAAGLPATLFSAVDINHDGFVSDAELRASGTLR